MFAGLGFKVDTSGLVVFKKAIGDARQSLNNLNQSAKTSTRQLRNLKREVSNLSAAMAKLKGAGSNTQVGKSYSNMAGNVHKLNNALNLIATNRKSYTKAIGSINSSVAAGVPIWENYRRNVVQTRRAILNLNRELRQLRANSRIDVNINRRGGNGAGGNGGSNGGGLGGAGGFAAGAGASRFFQNMLPVTALMGGFATAGFATKAVVDKSREQTRMESMILMTSKSSKEFASTVDYVRSEALRLGLSSAELGKSFAQINMSAKSLSMKEKKEMFTGFSEFMMSMGTSGDDQKGIFRAFNQMFSNNRILQEEVNQLSERGIPATLVYDAAMEAYGSKNIKEMKKLQKDGLLDPNKVLPVMAKMVQDLAHESGAFDKMMKSSLTQQGRFFEQLSQTSKVVMEGGLDEGLGSMFSGLADLAKEVEYIATSLKFFVEQIKAAKSWVDELSGGNTILAVVLFFLAGRFKFLYRAVKVSNRVMRSGGGILKAMTALMRGIFGKALGGMILKFTIWSVAITGVTKLLSYLGKELERDKIGGWTVFDEIAHQLDVVDLKFQIVMARAALFWGQLKNFSDNPMRAITGLSAAETVKSWFGYAEQPNQGSNKVLQRDYANLQNVSPYANPSYTKPVPNFNMQKMLDKAVNSDSRGVPYRSNTTSMSRTPSQLHADIYISNQDGTRNRHSQVINLTGNA